MRVAGHALLGRGHAPIDIVRCDTSRVRISISIEDLDVLLNVASSAVFVVATLERGCTCLVNGFRGANGLVKVIGCASWHFLSQLTQPERSMVRNLVFLRNPRFVILVGRE